MRKKLLFGALLCASVISTKAQWSLTGNAGINTATNFLGTTDNKALIFRTNNIERMRIGGAGKIGIGTTTPGTRFQINVATNQSPFSTFVNGLATLYSDSLGGLSVGGGTVAPTNGLYVFGSTGIGTAFPSGKLHVNAGSGQEVFRAQANGSTKLLVRADGGVSVGSPSAAPANGLFVNGSVGIGTTVPATKLHVAGGSDVSLSGGGFITSGSTTTLNIAIDDNEIMARNNGAAATLTLNNSGGNVIINGAGAAAASRVGIGTATPLRELEVEHGSSSGASFGLMISNEEANNQDWTFYTTNFDGSLALHQNGVFVGSFDESSGAYTSISDRRLKKDIEQALRGAPSRGRTGTPLFRKAADFKSAVSTNFTIGAPAAERIPALQRNPGSACAQRGAKRQPLNSCHSAGTVPAIASSGCARRSASGKARSSARRMHHGAGRRLDRSHSPSTGLSVQGRRDPFARRSSPAVRRKERRDGLRQWRGRCPCQPVPPWPPRHRNAPYSSPPG